MTAANQAAAARVPTGKENSSKGGAARSVAEFVLPVVIYYLARAAGATVLTALLIGAATSVLLAAEPVLHRRRANAGAVLMTALMVVSLAVSLIAGSVQFLLAKDSLLTGVTGVWFLVTARTERPLAYRLCKPLLEGRFRWPSGWDELWAQAPRFRRMWRLSTVLWGLGTLVDSVLRVVMAYTLPPDTVPVLSTALFAGTSVVLIVATNILYAASGAFNPASALYRRH